MEGGGGLHGHFEGDGFVEGSWGGDLLGVEDVAISGTEEQLKH